MESAGVALVTGGSRGIGQAIVEVLARSGWKVTFTYMGSREAAEVLAQALAGEGLDVVALQADVRDFFRAAEVVQEVESRQGPIELLVNNAGIKRDEPLYRMSPEAWDEVVDTNLKGPFNYTRAVLMGMIKRQSGRIVNIVSVSGILGLAGQANYSASKAGVIGLTKSISREVARFGIRVNAVAPGFIRTDMLDGIPEVARKKLYSQISTGEPGVPDDVARVVSFLAGEGGSYITGQVIPVDGGMI